jgi:hypothetical protein
MHGEYSGYYCTDCQNASRDLQRANEDLLKKLGELSEETYEAAYLSNNPGDYGCPACRLKSLKYLASRCPLCQSDISSAFWEPIKQAAVRHQKWLASPEYAAQQEEARKQQEKARQQQEAARREAATLARERKGRGKVVAAFCCLLIPFVGPIVSLVLAHMAVRNFKGTKAIGYRVVAICLLVFIYGILGMLLLPGGKNRDNRMGPTTNRHSEGRGSIQQKPSRPSASPQADRPRRR